MNDETRERSYSESDTTLKRKRKEIQGTLEGFQSTKKTVRSPIRKLLFKKSAENVNKEEAPLTEAEMEELKKMLSNLTSDVKEIKKGAKENKEELLQGIQNANESINKVKTELNERERKWEEDKTKMEQKINGLEGKMVSLEKENLDLRKLLMQNKEQEERENKKVRKNRIILKGLKIKDPKECKYDIEQFINSALRIQVKVEEAKIIKNEEGKSTLGAELINWQDKMKVMRSKHLLRGQQIYIEHDLTE